MAQTARISAHSDYLIGELSTLTGKSKIDIIESALETYRHQERMRRFNLAYKKLKTDKAAWEEEEQDRRDLEGTVGDGLED